MADGNSGKKNATAYSQEKSYDMMGRHREIGKWTSILEMIKNFFRRIFNFGGGRGQPSEREQKLMEEKLQEQRAQREQEEERLREEGRRQAYVNQKQESVARAAAMQKAELPRQNDNDTPKFLRNASASSFLSNDMLDREAFIRKKSEDSSPTANLGGYTEKSALERIQAARKEAGSVETETKQAAGDESPQTAQQHEASVSADSSFSAYNIDAFVAARHGDADALRDMIENPEKYKDFSIHQTNEQGYNLLHVASRHGSLNCIQILVETECDAAARNNKGESPLDVAADDTIRDIIAKRVEEQEEQGLRPFQ